MTMTFHSGTEYDGVVSNVDVYLTDEKSEGLPEILEAFVGFLQASGFTYVQSDIKSVPGGFLILKDDADLEEIGQYLIEEAQDDAQASFDFDYCGNDFEGVNGLADIVLGQPIPVIKRIQIVQGEGYMPADCLGWIGPVTNSNKEGVWVRIGNALRGPFLHDEYITL